MPRFAALVLALAALGAPLAAAETTPVTEAAPNAPAEGLGDLKAALPDSPAVVERDGALWWQVDGAAAVKVVAQADGNPQVETAIGRVAVMRKLVADAKPEPLAALPALVERAKADGVAGDGLTLAEGIMTGFHLRSADTIVLPEGTLRKTAPPAVDRPGQVAAVKAAADAVKATLAKTALDELDAKALADVLDRVGLADDARKFELDEVLPSFARRIIRHGYLRQLSPDHDFTAAATALETAVATSEGYAPATLFDGGKGLRLAEVKDAYGRGGWVLTTPSRVAYTRPHPSPMYLWTPNPNLNVVVQLPIGADPLVDGDRAVAVKLFHGSQAIAWWSAEQGFGCDDAAWRRALPEHPGRAEGGLVSGFLPPHVIALDLDGDIRRLITAHGAVDAPADAGKADAQTFLAQAAKALPDAAAMDLVGEYLFYYVYDSPDSRAPLVIGNKQVKGDIHQTADQTVKTACGGQCRGDCDDLSELYQTIAEKQGRTAHVITLPSHAACAFADKDAEGKWHVFVLQTGQPLEFTADDLPAALTKTYSSFDESDTFDPNGLGLLLRFSGENTRSAWRLSWRIFAEPEYAKTMIEVQKDWHFQTYQRGINTMLKLIADGDDDTANYRELSGLYGFTGQYDLAAEYHRKALERTPDPESRLYSSVELVQHLFDAGKTDEARKVAQEILDAQLPPLQAKLGPRALQLGLELTAACNHGQAWDLALRALQDTALDEASKQIEQVAQYLKSSRFNAHQWEAAEPLRRLQQEFVGNAIRLVEGMGIDALPENDVLRKTVSAVQTWLGDVAFHDVDDAEDNLTRYAAAGSFYAAVLGEREVLAMVDAAAYPTKAERDHASRIAGLAQLRLDLPWIKLSVPFWAAQLERKFEREEKTLDRELALKLGRQVAEADAKARALGFESPFTEHQAHIAAVITAIIGQDEPALRRLLQVVVDKNDKRLRDDTAQWLGDTARFCDIAWYGKVIDCWQQVVDYKPKWYWIAWRAALNHAPVHALLVAKRAAEHYADDQDFTEEYAFMRKLFAEQAGQPQATTPAEVPKQPVPQR